MNEEDGSSKNDDYESDVVNKKTGKQFGKFVIVGGLNTAIDIGVLNLLMWLFGAYQGGQIIIFNVISVSLAIINSYFWNKYFTFGSKKKKKQVQEFSTFVAVSLGGMIINTGIVYLLTTFAAPPFGLSQELWANAAKILAIGVAWIWNFSGYKFVVFKK